jgi:hypothetical protein
LLFPTVVKDPIYPTLSYNTSISSTIKIGTSAYKPIKVFNPGDSGGEISTTEKLLLDGVEIPLETAKFD